MLCISEPRDARDRRGKSGRLVGAGEIPGCVYGSCRVGAMLHAGDEEEAVEGVEVDAFGCEGAVDLRVEVYGAAGGD